MASSHYRYSGSALFLFLAFQATAESGDQDFRKAVQLFQERQLGQAKAAFIQLVHSASFKTKSRYYLGRICLLESKPREAVGWLAPVVSKNPAMPDAAVQLSKAYLETGELVLAKSTTKLAIRLAPWDGALHYRLGRIYQQSGDSKLASAEFAESVKLKTTDRESVQMLIECAQDLEKAEMAAALQIREAMLRNPSLDPDVLVALGVTFTSAGKQEPALDLFQTAARRDSNLFQAQFDAGMALIRLGRTAEATAYLLSAQQLVPDSTDANAALSLAYVMQTRYEEALPPLLTWRRLDPQNGRALNMLGLAYLRTNSAAKAIPVFKDSIRVSRADPKPYFLLIEALNAAERQPEGLKVAQKAVELFSSSAQAQLANAQQLARLGQYQEAGPLFRRALELAPEQPDCLLGLAEVQQKQGDYAASLATYDRLLVLEPKNLTALLGRGRNLIFLKRPADARLCLEAAVAIHPESSPLHFELSRVYARLGETQLAAEETKRFQDLRATEVKR